MMTEREFLDAHLENYPQLKEIYAKIKKENEDRFENLKGLIEKGRPWVQLAQSQTHQGKSHMEMEAWLRTTLEL